MITVGPILLMIPGSMSYFRGVLRGVRRNSDPRVWLQLVESQFSNIRELGDLKPRGLIGTINSPELADAVAGLDIPAVNVSRTLLDERFPYVGMDSDAIGRMAAKYLTGRGFQHFAFFGLKNHTYSVERRRGFQQELGLGGFSLFDVPEQVDTLPGTRVQAILQNNETLAAWLASVPKPIAVFCANDLRGRRVADAARTAGLRVPEDIAILSVDNDDVICALASPALSSISLPDENVGYEAAAVLSRMIGGEKATRDVMLPPLAVVPRASTDTLAVQDDDIADAMRFIREHAYEDITVEDVLQAVPLSRRWLEHKFERILGRTPAEEIRRLRLERAKDLLATTDLSMPEVARRAGFTNAKHLAASFRTFEDITPTEYRSTHRQRT